MAKGALITDKTRCLIVDIFLNNPKLRAKEIHAEVERVMGSNSPGESAVQKEVTKIRRRLAEMPASDLDKLWSIGALSKYKYDFLPEIIPILIEAQKLQMQSKYEAVKEGLTIRHAQWIARLYPLITEIYVRKYSAELDESKIPVNKEYLWMVWVIADMYAQMEKISEIVGKEYQDTTEQDKEFFITERFWEQSDRDRASYYAASRSIYEAVLKDYGNDRA